MIDLLKMFFFLLFVSSGMNAQKYCVRVLLNEQTLTGKPIEISCSKGFTLVVPNGKKLSKKKYLAKKVVVNIKKLGTQTAIYINKQRFTKNRIYLVPCSEYLHFDGGNYQGSFLLAKEKDTLLLINCIDVEDYLFSVLRTESWPGWPLEVNKVFAIACRSYALSMILSSRNSKRLYHVRNTNHHQTYSGFHDHDHLKDAVIQTHGVYLSYNKKPIVAMFDSCCGGVIPAGIENTNFDDAPYLARDYACTHCRRCKIYNWQAEFYLKDFEEILKNSLNDVYRLHGFTVKRRDKAGLVQEVMLKGKPKDMIISGEKMYSVFKEIKSFYFNVSKKGEKILFTGRGYGHHRGLCQWGAHEMVRHGWNHEKILEFYYPGTEFAKLT
ncbi:SpoIID/LytB domain-containing protein [Candidatus Dependentiae bacterium]|nr:SpoIID/LytB domain-containing protein [Candidatus Dependentiae bacterium]